MAVAFFCDKCGKSGTLSDKFAGKKVKCKCGHIIQIENPEVDLNNIQYEVVTDQRQRTQPRSKTIPKLSKKEREEKELAARLGEDWKNPKPTYHQVGDDEGEDWPIRLFNAMLKSPMLALAVYAASLFVFALGVEMLEQRLAPPDEDPTEVVAGWSPEDSGNVRIQRRRNPAIYLIVMGALGGIASLGVMCASLGVPELRNFYSKGKITFMIVAAAVLSVGFMAWVIYKGISWGAA
ncbi:MAG: hypothetical protein AAF623_08170 [Planctomycetota bacterium]